MKLVQLLFLLPFVVSCQTISPRLVCRLPDTLRESSGLIVESANAFWTMNDSGGEPKLYQIDSTGQIRRVISVINATNTDWEELATDAAGNFYIGDFGNNGNSRDNLKIYKIARDSVRRRQTDDALNAVEIKFRYADQNEFPPPVSRFFYDAEAMLAFSDSIFVFSKDFQTEPYVGSTHIYRVKNDATVGKQTVPRLDSVKTDNSWKYNGAITAAAMSPDGSKVVLMSYQKLFVFTDFRGREFWKGRRRELTFGLDDFVQREAAAFLDSCTLYITSERNVVAGVSLGGNLSKINLCSLLTRTKDMVLTPKTTMIISPNPSVSNAVSVNFSENLVTDAVLFISNAQGATVFEQKISVGTSAVSLENRRFPTAGFYICRLISAENLPLSMAKVFILR